MIFSPYIFIYGIYSKHIYHGIIRMLLFVSRLSDFYFRVYSNTYSVRVYYVGKMYHTLNE